MEYVQRTGLGLWRFPRLAQVAGIDHFVSDRHSGGNGADFTLSLASSPHREEVMQNRSRVARALGVENDRLYFPTQVHGTRVVQVTPNTRWEDLQAADALMTQEKGTAIAVMSADCVPLLLYDARHRAVAAVHAGWRGTVARIVEKTLAAMQETFGTTGADVMAAIGPSVSQQNYEVGAEVVVAFEQAFDGASEWLERLPAGKARLDLWKANAWQLARFGVPAAHIEVANLCSVQHNDRFFSARKGDRGRYAAGIVLR
jgi:hypothetical protein